MTANVLQRLERRVVHTLLSLHPAIKAVDKFVGTRADEIQFCYELTPARVYRRQVRRK